jgi:predicted RNase H-like nuclease (RuvC/YqgF family)
LVLLTINWLIDYQLTSGINKRFHIKTYLYFQYLELLEEFKTVHKATDKLKSNQYTAADIKKDIQQMEQENEQLTKTIERKKARVSATSSTHSVYITWLLSLCSPVVG